MKVYIVSGVIRIYRFNCENIKNMEKNWGDKGFKREFSIARKMEIKTMFKKS